jgi:hypothetical protein
MFKSISLDFELLSHTLDQRHFCGTFPLGVLDGVVTVSFHHQLNFWEQPEICWSQIRQIQRIEDLAKKLRAVFDLWGGALSWRSDQEPCSRYSGRIRSILTHKWCIVINFIQNCIQYHFLKVKSICRLNYWGIISVGFDIIDQLWIRFFAFVRYWK